MPILSWRYLWWLKKVVRWRHCQPLKRVTLIFLSSGDLMKRDGFDMLVSMLWHHDTRHKGLIRDTQDSNTLQLCWVSLCLVLFYWVPWRLCYKTLSFWTLTTRQNQQVCSFSALSNISGYGQGQTLLLGILKGKVSLYHWPPVWLVWNQLYDNWHFFAKQTNPNQ
jgi:hypothetical protein